ncbi:MAG: PAS domain-containing protein [Bacteroidota bacterium]|jgi:PAS domain S-box-containing protein
MITILEENCRPVKKEKRSLLPELRILSKHLEQLESDMAAFWKMNPALLMLVRNDKITKINPAWQGSLGYPQDYLIDKSICELVHEKDRKKLLDTIDKLKNEEQPQTIIVRYKQFEKDEWTFVKMSLSYDASSDSMFCTGWPLLSKCNDCPFLI